MMYLKILSGLTPIHTFLPSGNFASSFAVDNLISSLDGPSTHQPVPGFLPSGKQHPLAHFKLTPVWTQPKILLLPFLSWPLLCLSSPCSWQPLLLFPLTCFSPLSAQPFTFIFPDMCFIVSMVSG